MPSPFTTARIPFFAFWDALTGFDGGLYVSLSRPARAARRSTHTDSDEGQLMKMLPAIALAAFALSTNVSANLVTNGGFETFTGAFRSDGGAQLFSSSTGLTGWTVGARQEVALLETPNI